MKKLLIVLLLIVGCKETTEPQDCAGIAGGNAVEDCTGVCEDGAIIDIDGNCYTTIQIGDQIWMADNLKATHYQNGDEIPYPNQEDWNSYTEGKYSIYNMDHYNQSPINDPQNANVYGNLYNWAVVNDDRGVCPDGWHVPSDDEYTILTDYLGGVEVAGGKMKECTEGNCPESDYWNTPNTEATNESGFSGLPGGYRDRYGNYSGMNEQGFFWSSTEDINDSDRVWRRTVEYDSSEVYGLYRGTNKKSGFSIRCLKD